MKRIVYTFTLAALFAGAAQAQIPVTVTSQVTESPMTLAEFTSNTTRWTQQFTQMKSQIDQMRQNYESITGNRGMGRIYDDPKYRDYLPNDWQQVYDSVKQGGWDGLEGRAAGIYSDNKIYDSCQSFGDTTQRNACQAQAVKPSQDKAYALDAYDQAKGRVSQLDQLMGQIDRTQDPKAIAELQGRIAAEQAMIQNEQTKLQMYQMVADAEGKIQQQRQVELNAKANARRGWVQPQAN
ncbi:P-type DNA transfer protein VirB5 [Pseudomonas syringae group genomosp. 3]|uniref:Type IV secretion system protein n=1 Tax=Pseudomonas syringae pv. persicae TaxID=237306 RepID=A0A3M4ASY5_9PSED|nr:P-type DNA transfer protein VirB5 [Pseudomonas syringae group genomosp. 3]RMP10027.1 hypothetical protein ALQ30_200444 [Pseudomonas syringae pv. persicae]